MNNVHTYEHARRVHKSQSQPRPLRHQTYLWPSAAPSSLNVPDYIPSEYGPPVKTPADFIALRYLSQHFPSSLKLRTEQVLSSIDDAEFERVDRKYSQPVKKQKKPRSLVECLKARYPEVNGVTPDAKTIAFRERYLPKYSSARLQRSEKPKIHSATVSTIEFECTEEFIEPVIPVHYIIESICVDTVYPTITVVEQPQQAVLTVQNHSPVSAVIAQEISCDDTSCNGTVEPSQPTSDDTFDSTVVNVQPKPWGKRFSMYQLPTMVRRNSRKRRMEQFHKVGEFDEIEWNFKKRRRCVS